MFSLSAQTPRKDSGANGQTKAKDITENGLRIGDDVPDLPIASIHNYKTKSAKLSDFKGKLLILDFWATWCSPCVAMMPKMETLQKEFAGKLQFISISSQKKKDVLAFISKLDAKYRGNIPMVTDDILFSRYFPHVFLPHYVWIDQNGKVLAITDAKEITEEKIQETLKNASQSFLQRKRDYRIQYDDKLPLFMNENGGSPPKVLSRSILTSHQFGLSATFTRLPMTDTSVVRLTFTNMTIATLFSFAKGGKNGPYSPKNWRFLVKDTSALVSTGDKRDWYINNTYCYELVLPKTLDNQKYTIMDTEISRLFPQYTVTSEKSTTDVLALVRTDKTDKIKSKGGAAKSHFNAVGFELQNVTIKWIIAQLGTVYLQNYPLPIVDDTGYTEMVDIKVDAKLSDVDALNASLRKYGLAFEKKKKEIDVLVFRDKEEGK
ncbi:TlpA family protein disulfide reductase [Sphingobacterium thalpophilum]|uniref:TlpA family protein disulfide reductase n=1 Tax=Sphingobacterium thalpophilum TaxID=259 RepID=UPI0037DA5C33